MGIEIAEKRAKSYRKGLDNSRAELGTPTLFTQQPEQLPRTYAVSILPGHSLCVGEKLGIHLDGKEVIVLRGLEHVARFTNPTDELLAALAASHGEACATVQDTYETACIAEVIVC